MATHGRRRESAYVNPTMLQEAKSIKKMVEEVERNRRPRQMSVKRAGGDLGAKSQRRERRMILNEPPRDIVARDREKGIANVGLLAPRGSAYRNLGTPNMSREVEGLFGPRQEGTRRTRAGHKAELTWGPGLRQLYDEADQMRFGHAHGRIDAARRGADDLVSIRPSGLPELDLERVRKTVADEAARRKHIELRRDFSLGNGFVLLQDELKRSSEQVRLTKAGRSRLLVPTPQPGQEAPLGDAVAAGVEPHEDADPSPRSPLETLAEEGTGSPSASSPRAKMGRRSGPREPRAALERKARMAEAKKLPLRKIIEHGEIKGVVLPDVRTVKMRPSTREVRDEIAKGMTANVRYRDDGALAGGRIPYTPGINVQPNGFLVFRDEERQARMQREDLDVYRSMALLDPELSMELRKLEFQASQFNSIRATKTVLQDFLARRQDNYEWKFRMMPLPDVSSPRSAGHPAGTSPQASDKLALSRWRAQAAEEMGVADQERLVKHPWFAGLADLAVEAYVMVENNSVVSTQGGSALSGEQTYQLVQCVDLIVKSIMYLINSGYGFPKERYFELVLLVPPWLHDCHVIAKMFQYLCTHLGISGKENRAFYIKNSYPLPTSEQHE